ncbi:hypothetical protein ACFYZJ_20110 [Streptomyces sp. NPDC001848]|uniref:MmyB family transcriptional regulator n=1 Tax=Streptomyces sp. NPDC001848 TaxID=3364618 RepID=UPI0036CCA4C4
MGHTRRAAPHPWGQALHGAKHFHHPLVGDLHLGYEAPAVTGARNQVLGIYTAEPGSPSAEALRLPAGWTVEPTTPARRARRPGRQQRRQWRHAGRGRSGA